MVKKIVHLAVLATCLSLVLIACPRPDNRPGRDSQLGPTSPQESPKKAPLDYLEFFTGSPARKKDATTVVALHGLGDTPENFAGFFHGYQRPARFIVPRAPIPYGSGFAWFLTRLGSGEMDTLGREISTAAAQVGSLIRSLHTPKPPVIFGFSQGGMISYAVAVMSPHSILASIPISGLLPPSLLRAPQKDGAARPRIHALHGATDNLIPLAHAQRTVKQMRSIGLRADLEVFENTPHTISPPMRKRLFALLDAYLSAEPSLQ